MLRRLRRRLHLLWEHRKLGQLESQLGLLGWQQADYDSGTQAHVDELADYERSQAQITNESASLGLILRQVEEQRVAQRETFAAQKAERLAAQKPLQERLEEGEKALAELTAEVAKLEARAAQIDRELAAGEQRYRALLVKGEQSDAERREVEQLRSQALSWPQEKLQGERKLVELREAQPRLEAEVQEQRAILAGEVEALQALEKSSAESDEALVRDIAANKREKQRLERQIDEIEKRKAQPYRQIGRALADQRIEPLNQPEALAVVLAQRERISAHEARIAESLAESRNERRDHVWGSWVLLLSLTLIAGVLLWVFLHSR
jgi:chromosome segregation ATPase